MNNPNPAPKTFTKFLWKWLQEIEESLPVDEEESNQVKLKTELNDLICELGDLVYDIDFPNVDVDYNHILAVGIQQDEIKSCHIMALFLQKAVKAMDEVVLVLTGDPAMQLGSIRNRLFIISKQATKMWPYCEYAFQSHTRVVDDSMRNTIKQNMED